VPNAKKNNAPDKERMGDPCTVAIVAIVNQIETLARLFLKQQKQGHLPSTVIINKKNRISNEMVDRVDIVVDAAALDEMNRGMVS
jgi:hypothetical protein